MKNVVCECCINEKKLSMYYMLQKWTDFDTDWKQQSDNNKISSDVSKFTYFVCIWSSICSFSLSAESDYLISIYKSSYTRSSTF